MSAATEPLSKVDSAVQDAPGSPTATKTEHKRRQSSLAADVYNINDLEKEGTKIEIAIETQQLSWQLNKSPTTIGEPDILKKPLTNPKLRKIDLHFPLGLEVTARNLKGVTIKDALDAIHKQFKKKADDEIGDKPYLAGFEWDPEECYTRFIVHQKAQGAPAPTSKKAKKKAAEEGTA